MNNKGNIFKLFFNKYTLYGICLILLSVIIYQFNESQLFYISIIQNLLSTFGIALLMGAIFDFSKNSEAFISFISNILKQIIISKEFLKELNNEEHKNVLETLVKPTGVQIEQCSSIEQYYKKTIESFSNLYNKQFKTNLIITIIAESKDNKVICTGHVTHRRYKINDKYESFETSFEKDTNSISNSYILLPNGNRVEFDETDISNEPLHENTGKKYITNIPRICYDFPYITICKDFEEIGYDHWICFNWSSLTICDGINFELTCTNELMIKEYKIFDNPGLYNVNISDDRKKINIISNCWLEEYTGFTLTIANKNNN